MLGVADVVRRVDRLEDLARGLAREAALWRAGTDPLLYLERRAYLDALQDALAGLEAARVVLAQARQRLVEKGTAIQAAPMTTRTEAAERDGRNIPEADG